MSSADRAFVPFNTLERFVRFIFCKSYELKGMPISIAPRPNFEFTLVMEQNNVFFKLNNKTENFSFILAKN